MAETLSGIFSVREFNYRRNVLKLAPDAFITINDAISTKVVSPMETSGSKITDVRGGITSINVSCAIIPAGASRATIEVVAPQYKGLHTDYYITHPNGTRTPIFTPMMEIKIYMKGRYVEDGNQWAPMYYPVFWGMIIGVQENYSSGASTFSITCEDLLCWWRHQKITMQSSVITTFFGGATMNRFPSAFQNMSPWEIVLSMFTDTFFMQDDKYEGGIKRRLDMVYPQFSNIYQPPKDVELLKETWGPFSQKVIDYWNTRFGFNTRTQGTPEEIAASMRNIPLELYGMRGPISWDVATDLVRAFLSKTGIDISSQTSRQAKLDLDFGMLARVQPYGLFDNYGDGAQPTILSKLEIVNAICEKTNMEFFVDTNGSFVFKPPLYNLDVATGGVAYYTVGPEDIINLNANFDSNSIVNYLVVTGPLWQSLGMEAVGLHADFESIKKYGIRSEQINVSFGMNASQLKMIAVAEMTRRNGQAYTGSVSIPLRPEIRMGYPVYMPHIDTFYYVTGISHSYAYGSSATTDLSLQYKRERIFEDGTSGLYGFGTEKGDVLDACVMRERKDDIALFVADNKALTEENIKSTDAAKTNPKLDKSSPDYQKNLEAYIKEQKEQNLKRKNRQYAGPDISGYWSISKAVIKPYDESVKNPDSADAIVSNELLMITDSTVPYTDKNGYRHIGAFPFGANLVLMKNGGTSYDSTNKTQVDSATTKTVLNIKGTTEVVQTGQSNEESNSVPGSTSTEGVNTDGSRAPQDSDREIVPVPDNSATVDLNLALNPIMPSVTMARGNVNGTTIQRITQ